MSVERLWKLELILIAFCMIATFALLGMMLSDVSRLG